MAPPSSPAPARVVAPPAPAPARVVPPGWLAAPLDPLSLPGDDACPGTAPGVPPASPVALKSEEPFPVAEVDEPPPPLPTLLAQAQSTTLSSTTATVPGENQSLDVWDR